MLRFLEHSIITNTQLFLKELNQPGYLLPQSGEKVLRPPKL